mmetsp:Transcript_19226/g.53220  ORF Transcript_19226/g.53220 Transcript_19226/m.53220 type:complete len:89 (-) Transcript_19226:639-905(-)
MHWWIHQSRSPLLPLPDFLEANNRIVRTVRSICSGFADQRHLANISHCKLSGGFSMVSELWPVARSSNKVSLTISLNKTVSLKMGVMF